MKYPLNRLRVFRAERRISQLDLAEKVGTYSHRIWLIENSYKEAKPAEKAKLARALETTIAELFPEPTPAIPTTVPTASDPQEHVA